MISSNPTVYIQLVASYVEALEEYGYEPMLKLIGGINASLVCTCDKSWEGPKASISYPFISSVR